MLEGSVLWVSTAPRAQHTPFPVGLVAIATCRVWTPACRVLLATTVCKVRTGSNSGPQCSHRNEVLRTIFTYVFSLYVNENVFVFPAFFLSFSFFSFSFPVKHFHTWPISSICKVPPVTCVILLLCIVQLHFRSLSHLFKTFLLEYFR